LLLFAPSSRYGGKLIEDDELTGGRLLIVFFSVMIGANQFGQVGPNIESFSVARGAAYTIYKLIERQPTIDSLDDKGSKPGIDGHIDFVKCKFNYPSRPDIQVIFIPFFLSYCLHIIHYHVIQVVFLRLVTAFVRHFKAKNYMYFAVSF